MSHLSKAASYPVAVGSPRESSMSETKAIPARAAYSSRARTPRRSAVANRCSMQPEPLSTDVSGRCVCASSTRGGAGASRSRRTVCSSAPGVGSAGSDAWASQGLAFGVGVRASGLCARGGWGQAAAGRGGPYRQEAARPLERGRLGGAPTVVRVPGSPRPTALDSRHRHGPLP